MKFAAPAVTFKSNPPVEKLPGGAAAFNGTAATTATFVNPVTTYCTSRERLFGDGGGGFQCCWTTALVKVAVTR